MWWTPRGDQTLSGAEWGLFREGLGALWDLIEMDPDDPEASETGVSSFDRLQSGQKLAMLALVGEALSDPQIPHPDLTVNTEAAVAAVFKHILGEVSAEIDYSHEPGTTTGLRSIEDRTYWRSLVLAAHDEVATQEAAEASAEAEEGEGPPSDASDASGVDETAQAWSLPDRGCDDFDEWDLVVDSLANRVLWEDGDYDMGDAFLDDEPEEVRVRMELLGIHEDYYTDVAPDPTDPQLEAIRRRLRSLCNRLEPRDGFTVRDGIRDAYHDLLVGPCDAEAIHAETACPLLEEIGVCGDDGFDCSHAEWVELFRDDVLQASTAAASTVDVASLMLSTREVDAAARASESGATMTMDGGSRIEPHDGGWIVRDEDGQVLIDVDDPAWADADDSDAPAEIFSTPGDAAVARLRAGAIEAMRRERREAALKRLGRG